MQNIKKLLAVTLFLGLLCQVVAGFAQEAQSVALEGLIEEVGDGFFIITDPTAGEVRVNLSDDVTVYDGIAGKDRMAVGQYVYVQYNGVMTRSLPPQVTALKVGCYTVHGTVTAILDSGYIVEGDSVVGKVIVHMGEGMPSVYLGVPITVYYNSVMALTIPPQISAACIVVPMLEGRISAVTSGSFTLTEDNGTAHRITLAADTRLLTPLKLGVRARVYYSGTFVNDTGAVALEVSAISEFGPQSIYYQD